MVHLVTQGGCLIMSGFLVQDGGLLFQYMVNLGLEKMKEVTLEPWGGALLVRG